MQVQLEIPSVVVGFSLGAVTYLIFGLVTKLVPAKVSLSGKRESLASDNGPAAAADSEVEAEPSPKQFQWRPLIHRLGCATLLLLAVAALPAVLLQPQQHPFSHRPAESAPAPEPQSADPQPPLATPVSEPERVAEAAKEAAARFPTKVAAEGAAEAEGDGIMTLKLTRQQIAFPQEDGASHKTAYWGTVSVGEPPVDFSVVFDTGSGHLILPSSFCYSDTCRSHQRYRRSRSSTGKDVDYDGSAVQAREARDHITVTFGTGDATGVFVEDVVCLGEGFAEHSTLSSNESSIQYLATHGAIAGQHGRVLPAGCIGLRVIAATEMSEDPFRDFEFDGVLGLGLTSLSQTPEFNFMHLFSNMATQNRGQNPHMFAVFLADHDAEESQITFGGYAKDNLDEEISWLPVHEPEQGQWMVRVKSIRINDQMPFDFCNDGECRAIMDTGTSLIAVPSMIFPELFELLSHPAEPDECQGDVPKLHIELDGATVTLEPRDYAILERTQSRTRALITQREDDMEEDTCAAMLMAMDLPAPLGPKLIVLGEPVLRRYYTVYDSGSPPRVGLGRARHSSGEPAA